MVTLRSCSIIILWLVAATAATTTVVSAQENTDAFNTTGFQEADQAPENAFRQAFDACPVAPKQPKDRRVDKSKLKYATFNVEWLFLEGNGKKNCPGSGCEWSNNAIAMQHLQRIAKRVSQLGADIVQLDEVQDCGVLRILNQELYKLGEKTYVPYLVKGADASTGQNVALLTRIDPSTDVIRSELAMDYPIESSTCPNKRKSGSKSVSKNLLATFHIEGFRKPISVVAAHLLAMPTDESRCAQREAQAAVLASEASARLKENHHVIVSGDLNDWSMRVPDRNNNLPISNALGVIESAGFTDIGIKVAQPDRYSQWWDRNKNCVFEMTEVSTLDHILISNELFSQATSVKYHTDLYQGQCNSVDSDHYPISVTFSREF